jgi:hypothetical protein
MSQEVERERQQKEFASGLDHIQGHLVIVLTKMGLTLTRADCRIEPDWKPGKPIPEVINLAVKPEGAPLVSTDF